MLRAFASIAMCGLCVAYVTGATAVVAHFTPTDRLDAIRRAKVWVSTDIRSMDLKAGPAGAGSFAPESTATCDYSQHARGAGQTPKFWCAVASGDVVKVRYRERNGKVYGLVAASRLFWALGFGADRAYPVTVVCRGCPADPWKKGPTATQAQVLFDPATIDRRMPGRRLEVKAHEGWAWPELDRVDESAGGATVAERDALKLLAVFVQHTDTKAENQALICLDEPLRLTEPANDEDEAGAHRCEHPFMMVPDLGNTFGHANTFNSDAASSVNFSGWQATPIWRGKGKGGGCVGNLHKSATGSLDDPRISEAGRKFLADLLVQLSDAQLHDLFDVARFTRRDPSRTVDDWVTVFKQKRDEIVNATCAP